MFYLEIISAFLGSDITEDCFQEAFDCKIERQESLTCPDHGYNLSQQQPFDKTARTHDCVRKSFNGSSKKNIVVNSCVDESEQSFLRESQSDCDQYCNEHGTSGISSANETDSTTSEESLFYGFYSRCSESRFELCDSYFTQSRKFENERNEAHASGEEISQCCFQSEYSDTSINSDSQGSKKLPNYVRMGATIRERTRMHMLNDAFDDLRKVIPRHNAGDHQKLSKIATLRLAIQYINALVSTLQTSGVEIERVKGHCVGDRRGKRRNSRKHFY